MPKFSPKLIRTTQDQRRHLQERASAARRKAEDAKFEFPKPHKIVLAEKQAAHSRKIYDKWQTAKYRAETVRKGKIREARAQVDQLILFGTAEAALAAVEAFERMKF